MTNLRLLLAQCMTGLECSAILQAAGERKRQRKYKGQRIDSCFLLGEVPRNCPYTILYVSLAGA